ncbi:MAG TPA: fluoride efflux transporter CrcB [Firmicutes bacterium]|jgi:fluoride exporter|nr:fluoride efflux transporter CrcB [Bacillota bacterium]
MFWNILWVIIGGGIGSATRYLLTLLASRLFGSNFPFGTLSVNLGGCLLIGLIFSLADRGIVSPAMRLLLMTGFLGGLTTFSTYALESTNFFKSMEISTALLNIGLNNFGGFILVLTGFWLGRLM